MKQLIFSLTVAILLKPIWPIAEYILNYDYIVEKLCENKNKPILKCNGKCFLTKQLAKEANQKEKKPFSNDYFKLKLPIINWFQIQVIDHHFLESIVHNYKKYNKLTSSLFTSKMLRPPETA